MSCATDALELLKVNVWLLVGIPIEDGQQREELWFLFKVSVDLRDTNPLCSLAISRVVSFFESWLPDTDMVFILLITEREFMALVENQTDRKIKRIRSDRGGEYLSDEFHHKLMSHHITFFIPTLSNPHKPSKQLLFKSGYSNPPYPGVTQ